MTDKNKLADELHAFVAADPHEYPGHLVELFDRAEKALRHCSAESAHVEDLDYWREEARDIRAINEELRAEIERLATEPQSASMPQNVEVAIKRMKTLADTALPGRTYEEECQAQMRNACVLLEMAYRSQAESDK